MKRGSYLINVSRGSVVDEEAVADAMESGHLAGYAADTFEMEDWARQRSSARDQSAPVALCPIGHCSRRISGSAVASARLQIELAAANNILQALPGERPSGAINHPMKR